MKQVNKLAILLAMAVGCGGSSKLAAEPGPVVDDLDLDDDVAEVAPAEDAASSAAEPEAPPPAVIFRLVNTAKEELAFSVEKGWQPVIFAFSGKPPKARSILMFPTHCTAGCDEDESARCPVCEEPARGSRTPEKREVVAAGGKLEVPWDGEVFVYEKARVKSSRGKGCECYKKQAVTPDTYTVRACGLRITRSARSATRLQCVDGTMSFPAEGPQVVELIFPSL